MLEAMTRNWWTLTVRGAVAIFFGIAVWLAPVAALGTALLLFGVFALVDGAVAVVSSLFDIGRYADWWTLLLQGLVSVAAGLVALAWPGLSALAALWIIAMWAIATGTFEILAAIRLREEIEGEWLLGLGGALSILFGILLVIWPGSGILSLLWLVGLYAVIFGAVMVFLSFRVRSAHKTLRGFKQDLQAR